LINPRTFLDASKVFDRVHYCKLLLLLIKRGISACFIRNLVYMYCTLVILCVCYRLVSHPPIFKR